MSLAPPVSSAAGDDHHAYHPQSSSAQHCDGEQTQAEMTVPRALALNNNTGNSSRDVVACSNAGSATKVATSSPIKLTAGEAQATGTTTAISESSSTPLRARPTGRVVLEALDVKARGANVGTSVLSPFGSGTGGASRVCGSTSKDDADRKNNLDNIRLPSSSPLPPTEAAAGLPPSAAKNNDFHAGWDGDPPPCIDQEVIKDAVGNASPSQKETHEDDGDHDKDIDPKPDLPAPLGLTISVINAAAPDEAAQPREETPQANGSSKDGTPPPNASDGRKTLLNLGARLSSIPSFFQRTGSKVSRGTASDSEAGFDGNGDDFDDDRKTGRWNMLSSARSCNTEDYDDCLVNQETFAGYDSERARKNWRVVRAVFLALGIFRVGGLSRLRAKQLSAAEVKRGLRRNVTGGGQNIIPTMSFYAPKVAGDGEASVARYETLCSQWARFSPAIVHRMLRQKLLEHGTSVQEFTCQRFSTTLLFADISGFTRLSARLNAEQLKTHTNQYFTMLIDVVARYGGDIIKFCGDAVMIIWPSESSAPTGVLQANAMQGAACALAMLNECGEYDVGKGEEAVALRLHCGMGSGQMYGYLVGAEDRWEYLVAGDPLRQIGEAEPEATQGEVILSPEAWELASTDFVATKTPQGNWLLKELREATSFSRPSSPTRGDIAGERIRRPRTSAGEHHTSHTFHSTGAASDGGYGSGGSVDGGGGGVGGGGKHSIRHRGAGGSPTNGNLNAYGGEKIGNSNNSNNSSSNIKKVGDPSTSSTPRGGAAGAGGGIPRVGSGGGGGGGGGRPGTVPTGRSAKKDRMGRMESFNNTLGVFRRDRDRTVMNHSRGNINSNNNGSDDDGQDGNERSVTVSTSGGSDLQHHHSNNSHINPGNSNSTRRGSSSQSSVVAAGLSRALTVTKNINKSSAVPEGLRVQASEYLASYIKAQYDGGVETSMRGLSTALRGFTQESARHAIQSDTVKYLAEIRFVTTIFINIYGLEEQLKHGGGFLLQQTMDLGVSSLLKFGGVLRQFVVDDKGCVMIGAFGLPQYSYEDNEVRAISASKEIILAFQGLQLAASIGVTTGQVYCGFVGASKRCEYAMMGCSVNLSARLMASAPKNTIQVDFEVWKRAHNFFDFETLTPIKAKGYVDPVPVFRPLGLALKDDNSKRMSDAGTPGNDLMVGVNADLEVLENSTRRLQAAGTTRPVILLGQSGSGKTCLVRSAQLRRIWRDATKTRRPSRPTIEKEQRKDQEAIDEDGSENKANQRRQDAAGAPVIITVCRNVDANTPYCIWNSILDKIFKSSSGRTGGASAQVSFRGINDAEHGQVTSSIRGLSRDDTSASGADNASPAQEPALDAWAENGKDGDLVSSTSGAGDSSIASVATSHLLSPLHGGGTTSDGTLSPTRNHGTVGHLPPLVSSCPVGSTASTLATAAEGERGGKGERADVAELSVLQRHTTVGFTTQVTAESTALARQTMAVFPAPGISPRSTGPGSHERQAGGGLAGAKPASLLKQQSESSLRQPRTDASKFQTHQAGAGGGGRRTFVMPSSMRKGEGSTDRKNEGGRATVAKHGENNEHKGVDQATTARVSMHQNGGSSGGERLVATRRPQRYDKIKMKSPVNGKKNKGSILNRAKTPPHQSSNCNSGKITGATNNTNEDEPSTNKSAPLGAPPQALKVKLLARGAIGAVSVAQRVVSGFRGEPDWASGSARTARKRSSSRWHVSGNEESSGSRRNSKRHMLGSVRVAQGVAAQGVEKSRMETASKRTFIRRGSARMTERTVRDGSEACEIVREMEPSDRSGVLMAPMLTAEDLKGITSVEMEMEGMESGEDPVSAVGEAAVILEWMRRSCPDMVPMAPLLQELLFAGFSETRMTASFPPDVRHRNLERLVVEVVRTAIDREGKRLLLIVEDAQWMNQLSMKLLLKLAKAGLRLMIVISARPFEEYFETVPHDFTSFREIGTTIEMSPLSPSDCLVLARHVIGEDVLAAHPKAELLPDGSDVVLHEKSGGGNPLFVRNIAITLRDNLLTSGTVTPLVDLPAGFFHALIVSRFDALEPPEQTVLKAGTVIGATFSKDLLLHMLPNNSRDRTENLHAALLKLIEANFISRSVVGRTEHFSFVHTSVQETVYKMMLTDQKENLHEVCAEWHEKHNKGNANYQSVITHHWMRSSNTSKKVECHLMAARKAQEVFQHEAVIQHMLALLAIAFGKDMATATVMSMEPFLEATQPSLTKQVAAAAPPPPSPPPTAPPPPPPPPPPPRDARGSDAAGSKGDQNILGNNQQDTPKAVPVGMTAPTQAATSVRKRSAGIPRDDRAAAGTVTTSEEQGLGLCSWFVDGMGSTRLSRKRRRFSSMVVPVATPLTGKEAEAAERLDAARTAARLGCSVGNLSKRQREMLVAKDQEWLWAADFLPCLEFSDPMFTPTMIARWIGAIGMAHLHLGRLLPAHNHMQEALVYLRFPAVPSQALPLDRIACLAKECCLSRGPARDPEDILFAARLYGSIADISIKTGMGGNLAFINRLERVITRGLDFLYNTHEGVRLIVNLANEELAKGHHDKVDMLLERAIALSIDIGDPITRGIALIASGTYNAGDGLVTEAEEDFAQAFEMFAPAGDYSRCGQVVVESAYVKLCSGDTPEALSMFNEVQDTAVAHKDDFLSQASLHGAALVHAITGNMEEASAGLAQMRCIVEEDWARRRGRRGRTAAATEGTSHASLVVMETLDAYLAASRGDGKAALKGVCRASLRLSRPGALRFSSGLFLHLATDACFTILEQDMLPPGPDAHRRILAAARLLVRTLGRFAEVFDLMSPLHQLGRARWGLLHGMDKIAEKALDLGLVISEEDVHFPFAEGILLLHSTRLDSLPMDERRARARRGRRTLHRIGACLIPPADRHTNIGREGREKGQGGAKETEGGQGTDEHCVKAAAA